jgi:hypothetical protein
MHQKRRPLQKQFYYTYQSTTTRAMVRKTKESVPVAEHHGGGHITVTAQQSRYALDAVDAPASKEVY